MVVVVVVAVAVVVVVGSSGIAVVGEVGDFGLVGDLVVVVLLLRRAIETECVRTAGTVGPTVDSDMRESRFG